MTDLMPRTPPVIDGELVEPSPTPSRIDLWFAALLLAGTGVASAVALTGGKEHAPVPISLFLAAVLLFALVAGRHTVGRR